VGPIKTIAAQYENYGKSKVAGIDIDARGRWSAGAWGIVSAGLELNRQLTYRQWDSYAGTYTENYVGYRGTPRTIAVARLSWEKGPVVAGLRARHTSATRLAWGELDSSNTVAGCADRDVAANECRIASDTTVDLWTRYAIRPATSLSANVFNLFDRQEPVQLRPGSGLPLRSRTLMVTLEHAF
jgi:iron complex outermembrane receptor protein